VSCASEKFDVEDVRWLARAYGWAEVQFNAKSRVLGFNRGSERVNVIYTTGTVGTCVDHPERGKTQLFREGMTPSQLRDIFVSPRVHTGQGAFELPQDALCSLVDSKIHESTRRHLCEPASAHRSGCF
jgi:hypothetical protein